nr:hypothetical protein ICEMyc226_00067 [Mycolicibacterium sp.]
MPAIKFATMVYRCAHNSRCQPRVTTALGLLTVAAACLAFASPAAADPAATVKARTQRMSDANLSSNQNGWYSAGEHLSLVCSRRGQPVKGFFSFNIPGGWDNLWYRTSDGNFVADVDIETGTLSDITPDCGPDRAAAAPAPAAQPPASASSAGRVMGRTQARNPGVAGQCTWGAAQKWFEATGGQFYPALSGDALEWANSARAEGWTVVNDAQPRSIVVLQPGVHYAAGAGHAAWVDSVEQRADGKYVHITEMNNSARGGVGVFDNDVEKDVPGMSYILLP